MALPVPSFARRFTILQRLLAVAILSALCSILLIILGVHNLSQANTNLDQMKNTTDVSDAVNSAYQGWLTEDDQTNMYVALVALDDPSQAQFAEDTFSQAMAGHDAAVKDLQQAKTISTDGADFGVNVDKAVQALATYQVFVDNTRKYAQAGQIHQAINEFTVANADASTAMDTALQDRKSVV